MPETTHYTLLGVPEDATAEQVCKAYRRKAKEDHPDKRLGDSGATERFQALGEAYTCLKDPDQRVAYDVLLATQRQYRAVRAATQQGTDIRAGQRQARGRQSSQPYPDNDDSSSGSGCAQPRSKARSAPQQYTQYTQHRARQQSQHGRDRDWRRMEEERQEQRMWEREERRSVAQRQEDGQRERERRRQSDEFWAGLAEMGHIIHIVEGYQSVRHRRRQRWWSRLMFWRRR